METTSKTNLLLHIETISNNASKCNLNFKNISKERKSIETVAEFLSITFEQAVLFSCLVELSLQRIVTLEFLAQHLNCSVLKLIVILNEFEILEQKKLIKRRVKTSKMQSSYNDIGFGVPHHVIESLRISDKNMLNQAIKYNFPNFLQQVKNLSNERENDLITHQQLMEDVKELILNNQHHVFIRYINQNVSQIENKCIALLLAFCRMKGVTSIEVDTLVESMFDDTSENMEFQRSILTGRNELMVSGIIYLENNEFANQKVVSLSKQTTAILNQEYPEIFTQEINSETLIKADSIVEKPLFFATDVKYQVDNLRKVLAEKQFNMFKKFARKQKICTGVTAIFSGFSGTGKTEAVYQIARETKRDVMMLDLSQTKSMWFGESEKQVQQIFDSYKKLLKASTIEPILFINEADGFFSKRLTLDSSSMSVGQTLNTMQNIMLQALENFEGILIATTNLTENLDSAFERRFLFKIEFPKPDSFIRTQIWKNRLPELSIQQAQLLGQRYELSGGQIDNMIRQLILWKVINPRMDTFALLSENCSKETGFSERKPIGF